MTTDDCLWVESLDSVTLKSGLFITKIIPGGVADKAGLKDRDILIAMNGIYFKNGQEAMNILNSHRDEYLEYTIIRNGQLMVFNIWVYKFINVLYFIFWLIGIGFWFVGFLVGYSKPKEFASQLFFLLGCTASTGLLLYSSQISFSIIREIEPYVFVNLLLLMLFFHPLFIHFLLTYPIKYKFKHRKLILILTYLIIFLVNMGFIIYNIISADGMPFNFNNYLISITCATYIFAGILAFSISYRKISDATLRKPLKSIRLGFLIGSIGFIYYLLFRLVINTPIFLINIWYFIPITLVLAIPVSFGYSIFKYKILDTEFIIKRGLVFGLVTIFIIGFYLLIVYLVDSFLSDYIETNRQFITIAFIIIITFTFDFVNKKAKELVDKQFFKERYNYRKSLLEFSRDLSYLNNIYEIINKVSQSVKNTMGIKKLSIWIKDISYENLINNEIRKRSDFNKQESDIEIIYDSDELMKSVMEKIYSSNSEPVQLSDIYMNEFSLSKEQKNEIRRRGIILSIPLLIKDKHIGSLNFGEKLSAKTYTEEDIDMLKTVTSQSAIAFENTRLQFEELNKRKIEEELEIAKKIQMGLLPKENELSNLIDISGVTIPAKIIGGDFYDLIKINEKQILIVVADVAGKGIPAALYMSKIQAMIQFASKIMHSPRDILVEINKQIVKQIEKRYFITIVAALFDLDKKTVKISRAGHNPVIISTNGKIKILKNKGIGLGLEDDMIFSANLEETVLNFSKDNLFLFYSDGLTEAMNRKRDEYGTERLINDVSIYRNFSSKEILDNILESVDTFRDNAEQNDDITFVVVKIK